jgi:hypothetical protein
MPCSLSWQRRESEDCFVSEFEPWVFFKDFDDPQMA